MIIFNLIIGIPYLCEPPSSTLPLSPLSTSIHADLEVEVIFALAFPCILYWLPSFLTALRRDTHLQNTIDTTTSNAGHQANGTPDDFYFVLRHHQVFLVNSPLQMSEGHHHFLYVEGKLSKEEKKEEETFFKISKDLPGHKFWVDRRATEEGVQDTPCSHPFHSNKQSRMRPLGWVRREAAATGIKTVCEKVPRGENDCCHVWTKAAIARLLADKVLLPLRDSDDSADRDGPTAIAGDNDFQLPCAQSN